VSGQIHADFLRLLWVLAYKQMRSYYESMGKEDKIGTEVFDGRGPRYSTATRLQFVGPLPLDARFTSRPSVGGSRLEAVFSFRWSCRLSTLEMKKRVESLGVCIEIM